MKSTGRSIYRDHPVLSDLHFDRRALHILLVVVDLVFLFFDETMSFTRWFNFAWRQSKQQHFTPPIRWISVGNATVRPTQSEGRSLTLKSSSDTHATVLIDGAEVKYDWVFLRDSCQCPKCVDPSTRQKVHHTADVPLTISPRPNGLHIVDSHTLEVHWNQPLLDQKSSDGHRSLYSIDWLRTYSSPQRIAQSRYHERPSIRWNRRDLERVNLHVHCDDYLNSEQGLYTVLKLLNDYGLVFIDDVQGEFAVERLTERIGEIRQTFYGRSWDVKSVEQAKNVAYTSQSLGLHMDLLYFEAPPGLQLLHSLANSVKGGASYYMDSFRVAELLRQEDPEAFDILCSYPVTFHYRNAGRHYHFTRSTIVFDRYSSDRRLDHVNYSPPFQAPFESDTSQPEFRRFLRAFQRFSHFIDDPENQFEVMLEKGQCVIFHNRRVLHARREFDATSGDRWLKGCYTDLDNFHDRLRVYREKFDRSI